MGRLERVGRKVPLGPSDSASSRIEGHETVDPWCTKQMDLSLMIPLLPAEF